MKKFKKFGYIVLIVIVLIMAFTIYTNAFKGNDENQKDKVFSEIKFLEIKMINLFNTMNNIKTTDYNIVTTEISKETTQNNSSSEGENTGGSSSGSEQEKSQGQNEGAEQGSSTQQKEQEKFELKSNDILTMGEQEINWDSAKSEIENLYSDLASITMDLYQIGNINQEDILNFNSEMDNLTAIIKEENKEKTLTQLTKVYDFLPKFLRSSGQEELYTTIVETKSNIFKGYAKLDSKNWSEISNNIKSAIDTYSRLLTDTNIDKQKQSNINKSYIMLNELQNAVNLEDRDIFLLKYKNLLEVLNNM